MNEVFFLKKFAILIALMLLFINSPLAFANSAQSSILIDSASGRVLQENNAYDKLGMASTTKIMTAIVALEHSKLTDIVTVSANAANVEGTKIYLKPGEKITMENLLYGLLLQSGNDAAIAIAEHISGSTEKFADLMNKEAEKIGVKNTHFTNPSGLSDPRHYTTAYDLAEITRYALQNETFAKIVATQSKVIPNEGETWGRQLTNHNKMLFMYDGADGVKTGFTKATGRTLVTSATRNDLQLIAVTLGDPNDWQDQSDMLDYGFANYKRAYLLSAGLYIRTVKIKNNYYSAQVGEDLVSALKPEELNKVEYNYNIEDALPKNFKSGDKIGIIQAEINGEVIGQSNLIGKLITQPQSQNSFTENYSQLWYLLSK